MFLLSLSLSGEGSGGCDNGKGVSLPPSSYEFPQLESNLVIPGRKEALAVGEKKVRN